MLDRQIAKHGQPVSFKRAAASLAISVWVRAFRPDELVGTITQRDRHVTVSPTGLSTYGIPREQDKIIFGDGKTSTVQGGVEPIYFGTTLVRVDLVARGD